MKAVTLRKYLVVHTWAGILSSLMLFVAFYAGALAMFEPEITHWAGAPEQRSGAGADPDALASAFFAGHTGIERAKLVLADEDNPAPYIRYQQEGRQHRVELDVSGRLRSIDVPGGEAGDFVDHVHRKGGLPLPSDIAEPVIGIVSLLYAVALVSGVVVLMPSLIKDLFALRIGRNIKRMWLDAHNLLGISSLPFHIVIAASAAVFCLHDWIYDMQGALIYPQGLKAVEAESRPRRTPVPADPSSWLPPSQLIARVKSEVPGFEPVALDYRGIGSPKAIVHVGGADDSNFKRSPRVGYALVSPDSGKLVQTTYLPGQQDSGWAAALVSFFSLHFGSYGGEPLRLIYAVLGVLGALLFYTGNVLWIETRTKRLRAESGDMRQPRHVRWIASLNAGVCAGCIAGLAAAIVACRWLAATPVGIETVANTAYYLVFLACVVYAFVRGARSAAPGLLWSAAGLTAMIPLTSLAAGLMPDMFAGWAPWLLKPYARGFFYVDGLSVAGAALLVWLAMRSGRGDPPGRKTPPVPTEFSMTHQMPNHD